MELRLGKMTNKEIAEWMGLTQNAFNRSKDKKLESLSNFAEYHMEGKKVVIDKIINPVYSKESNKTYEMVKNKVDELWSPTGLDLCKNVSNKIIKYYGDELNIGEGTTYLYTRQGRNELYGKPFEGSGALGKCSYTWCKKGEDDELLPLTQEEEKIKQELIKKYFGDASEKQIIVSAMVEKGEITQEEAWGVLTELTNMKGGNFLMFLGELQEKLNCKIVRGTMVERYVEERGAIEG